MQPRIEWSPDGRRVLVVCGGVLEIRELDGTRVRSIAPRSITLGAAPNDGEPATTVPATYLDARWLSDGRIMAVDRFALPRSFTMRGEAYGDPEVPPNPWTRAFATVGAAGTTFATIESYVYIYTTAPKPERLFGANFGYKPHKFPGTPVSIALARDGAKAAIVFAFGNSEFGWMVVAGREDVLERHLPEPRTTRPLVAFDHLGNYVITTDEDRARYVTYDASGTRVAYACGTHVRVDYLAASESVTIDAGFEVVALAFGPEDRIACLAADGTFDIVPVP